MSTYPVAVIVGSLRRQSHNKALAAAATRLAPPDLAFRTVEIGDLPLYNQDDDGAQAASVVRFKGEIAAAKGLLFAARGLAEIILGEQPPGPEFSGLALGGNVVE